MDVSIPLRAKLIQMVEEKRSATHEASHVVVAKLFEDFLKIKYVTISLEKIKEINSNSGNTTTYGFANVVPQEDKHDLSCIGFVLLAGIVGEKIMDEGRDKLLNSIKTISSEPEKVESKLGSGDLEYFNQANLIFGWKYGAGEYDFRKACFTFLINFLCDNRVWKVVVQLAEEMIKKDDQTLEAEELRNFFEASGFDEFLKGNRDKLLKEAEPNIDTNSEDEILKKLGVSDKHLDLFSVDTGDKSSNGKTNN